MFDKLKSYLEGVKIDPISWLLGVSAIFMVRFFLEAFSSPTADNFFAAHPSTVIHYYLFFLSFSLVFVLLVQKFLTRFSKVAFQFVAIALVTIFLAPIIDWIFSYGSGFQMTYLFDEPNNLFYSLISFFGPNLFQGITLGLRVEILTILIVFGLLAFSDHKKRWRAFILTTLLYILIFIFVSFPAVFSLIAQFGNWSKSPIHFFILTISESATFSNNLPNYLEYGSLQTALGIGFNLVMAKIWFLVSVFLASFIFYKDFKDKFIAVIKNSRPERVAHYIFMICIGILTCFIIYPETNLNWLDWLSAAILFLAFYFSWMFAVCGNDKEDLAIDQVSNQNRPLVQQSLSEKDNSIIGKLFLFPSLLAGFLLGLEIFFLVLSFTAIYYSYSIKPTRFKLIPFFSSLLIGFCCLTAVLAGFFLFAPSKDISIFPDRLAFSIVVVFFLWSHIRDMKDIAGDKIAQIPTVPVIFGDVWGPRVVGILTSLTFILIPILMERLLLFLIALPASFVNYYFVTKQNYSEKPIFIIYLIFVVLGFCFLQF